MNKTTLRILILSVIMLIVWIAYAVYSNISGAGSMDTTNVAPYLVRVDPNMYIDTLQKVNTLSGNIKITNQSLAPTASPSPTAAQ